MKKSAAAAVCAAAAITVFTAGFFAGKCFAPGSKSTVIVYEQKKADKISLPLGSDHSSLLNINTADYDELCALPGIGPELASRILAYRELNGGFEAIEELENIHGISQNIVAGLIGKVRCY